ncbi:hypothetical protein KIF59_03500 [Enterobacter cloacae subsp. cloacae]|nr:hypothetical protein [Enterobacter cloacae subsp. cloacae]
MQNSRKWNFVARPEVAGGQHRLPPERENGKFWMCPKTTCAVTSKMRWKLIQSGLYSAHLYRG